MGDHRTIENGEFIICETAFQTGQPCGRGGWTNREEREISRHYRKEHGYAPRQHVPYHLCAIVSEAAVRQLVDGNKVDKAMLKDDGREEKAPMTPRYPNWMPGGGRAAYLAAINGNAAGVPAAAAAANNPQGYQQVPHFPANPPAAPAPVVAAPNILQAHQQVAQVNANPPPAPAVVAAAANHREGARQNHQAPYILPAHVNPVFGGREPDEYDHIAIFSSSSDESDSSESSEDSIDAALMRRMAIKTLPGYGDQAALATRNANLQVAKKGIDVHDFKGALHQRGFLALSAFESIIGEANEAINPFCMTNKSWDHAIRVVNAYFRTNRTEIFENKFLDFLRLFGRDEPDSLDSQLELTKWFYESRKRTEDRVWDAAIEMFPERQNSDEKEHLSGNEIEAHCCYVCGRKFISFRDLDVHYLAHHRNERAAEVAPVYRKWWETKLFALQQAVDDEDPESAPIPPDGFACHHCDIPFDDLDAIDVHFSVEHRQSRKGMLVKIFNEKFKHQKQARSVLGNNVLGDDGEDLAFDE